MNPVPQVLLVLLLAAPLVPAAAPPVVAQAAEVYSGPLLAIAAEFAAVTLPQVGFVEVQYVCAGTSDRPLRFACAITAGSSGTYSTFSSAEGATTGLATLPGTASEVRVCVSVIGGGASACAVSVL